MRRSIATIFAGSLALTATSAIAFENPCAVTDQSACESASLYGEPACSFVAASKYTRNGKEIERPAYCRKRSIVNVIETLVAKGVLTDPTAKHSSE